MVTNESKEKREAVLHELDPLVIIESSKETMFADKCNEILRSGKYKLSSSSCGFVNSEKYDFCGSFHAIFILKDYAL